MQSAIAATTSITGITKANPAVATSTAHGLADGDIVFLEIQGMRQLDQKAVRVANKTLDTFECEGIDSTLFDTFVSGTVAKVTLGTSISTATNISASGGEVDVIDTTTIHDGQKSQIPGLPSAISFSMENIWDAADGEERRYRKEIRTTLLHELGHSLGWEEAELEARHLD